MRIKRPLYLASILITTLLLGACNGGSSSTSIYTVSGTVTGLSSGQQVTLLNNAADPQTVTSNAGFNFDVAVAKNGSYAVTVGTQPDGQICTVSNGSGTGVVANISNVAVTCSTDNYAISGNVSGLVSGQVTLLNNGADPQIITSNTRFSFNVPVTFNSSYSVTVGTQPAGQICTVTQGSGSAVTANVSNVSVSCSTNTYTISGSVSGLASGQVTLLNNGADPQIVTSNGGFNFNVPVTFGSGYAVTVGTQPLGQICTVSNGSGAGVVANISNVTVTCSTEIYTISGRVSGLASGQVTLLNNGTDPQIVTSNAGFNFDVPVTFNSSYAVTVGTQPVGQICTVSNGSGAGVVANISNVTVTCSTDTYTISGNVYGLSSGQVTLLNNGADPQTVTSNTTFNFDVPVTFNSSYAVTIGTQPTGQTCTVTSGSGTAVSANVSNVSVICSTSTYTISGHVTGLNSGEQVTLNNNGANSTIVTSNTAFHFSTQVAYSGAYAVNVGTQPLVQSCNVTNGTGFNVTANVGNVRVVCGAPTETVLYSFAGGVTDGSQPVGITLGGDGNFYGITNVGGTSNNGTVYKITPAGVETVLYSFVGGPADGANPNPLILAGDGNFYGTTTAGGASNNGTVFKITPAGVESLLYSFAGGAADGASPGVNLTLGNDGNFYGTTYFGGTSNNGTVYRVTPAGVETVLYSFAGGTADGANSVSPLTLGSDGNFYSMTSVGGASSVGTVFKITPTGVESLLYSFAGGATDGAIPFNSSLVLASDGNFYGATQNGGATNNGIVFKITPGGVETVLYSFAGGASDGSGPDGPLVIGRDGNFYGLTTGGGASGIGTIYRVTPAGVETNLYSFAGGTTDGSGPFLTPIIVGNDGYFYGVTFGGGASGNGIFFRF